MNLPPINHPFKTLFQSFFFLISIIVDQKDLLLMNDFIWTLNPKFEKKVVFDSNNNSWEVYVFWILLANQSVSVSVRLCVGICIFVKNIKYL